MNYPTSVLKKINRIWVQPTTTLTAHLQRSLKTKSDAELSVSVNACGIQMLPKSIHRQIFGGDVEIAEDNRIEKIKEHLSSHGLWEKQPAVLPNVHINLPKLKGKNITEHFRIIAEEQAGKYRDMLINFISSELPAPPEKWNFSPGWTKYSENGEIHAVEFPDEDAYVFDVEVCVKDGHYPTLATAVSSSHWYSWCSNRLFTTKEEGSTIKGMSHHYSINHLINLETKPHQSRLPKDLKERIVIGHNVNYDRARVKEQYFIEGTNLRFLDTMAMHIAVSGITSFQRTMLAASRREGPKMPEVKKYGKMNEILEWQNVSSFNGLSDVYKLYCGGAELEKSQRDTFVHGSLSEIKAQFQELTLYCAKDVQATFRVLQALLPEFLSRFPHPVTLAGTLEMSTMYLPVNQNWIRYNQDSEDAYIDLESELTQSLRREADRACGSLGDDAYREDPWLWDLDWSKNSLKVKKPTRVKPKPNGETSAVKSSEQSTDSTAVEEDDDNLLVKSLESKFSRLFESKDRLHKRNSQLPGYPNWYKSLFSKGDVDGLLGPSDISTSSLVVPKILKLTWEGYPLHHNRGLGWGYLVPGRPISLAKEASRISPQYPVKNAVQVCSSLQNKETHDKPTTKGLVSVEDALRNLETLTEITADPVDLKAQWNAVHEKAENVEATEVNRTAKAPFTSDRPTWHNGIGPYDVGIAGCWFFRLPHKSGLDNNVGNPLAKDYLNKIEDGTLKATSSHIAEHILKLNRNIIYWRNARDRILSQMVVWLNNNELPRSVTKSKDFDSAKQYGAILPQVVCSGTLTRRAVESTWLTASNAYSDRLGSELKSMIQSPPGYCLVGADVDSQELWIASVIGDSYFAGEHGCTAFGWMTLQGKKSDGTDMHSRTASTVDISRDQAKILNYGRIYGAGERFAKSLLMQFNHRLTEEEAIQKARKIYSTTKGECLLKLSYLGHQLAAAFDRPGEEFLSKEELLKLRKECYRIPKLRHLARRPLEDFIERRIWVGGTESHMFNKLEEIAQSPSPQTPVLHCRISRALEPQNVGNDFMTSRINWVVQSSAVDYLHLMLVSMRYLFDKFRINGRFCISIHDEVRYLVKEEDQFRAALALQITNLWTRCMFAYQMGLRDLPQSVAFFSSVDIDTVLRKETHYDCKTPSNPYGLKQGYGIPFGTSYDIYEILEKTKGTLVQPDASSRQL